MVICPRSELESAVLLVKGKMLDLDFTGALIDGGRKPVDAAIEKDDDIGEQRYLIGSISTVSTRRNKRNQRSKSVFEAYIVRLVIVYRKAMSNNL